jgi:Ni,Fe-hydrogenase III large subunit
MLPWMKRGGSTVSSCAVLPIRNWPALTIAVQGDIIPDFPLINKSFELCYACLDR